MLPITPRRRLRLSLAFVSLVFLAAFVPRAIAVAGDNDWKPIDPAHVTLKAPAVEKDADAEALVWEVRVDDGGAEDLELVAKLTFQEAMCDDRTSQQHQSLMCGVARFFPHPELSELMKP